MGYGYIIIKYDDKMEKMLYLSNYFSTTTAGIPTHNIGWNTDIGKAIVYSDTDEAFDICERANGIGIMKVTF